MNPNPMHRIVAIHVGRKNEVRAVCDDPDGEGPALFLFAPLAGEREGDSAAPTVAVCPCVLLVDGGGDDRRSFGAGGLAWKNARVG
jgi:hypothetical protein